MNKREHFVNSPHTGFHLNLQIIADDFAEKKEDVSILCREDPLTLDGLRIYQAGALLKPCYLYLVFGNSLSESFLRYQNIAFVVVGSGDLSCFPKAAGSFTLREPFLFLRSSTKYSRPLTDILTGTVNSSLHLEVSIR